MGSQVALGSVSVKTDSSSVNIAAYPKGIFVLPYTISVSGQQTLNVTFTPAAGKPAVFLKGASFAYSPSAYSFHARRDRVVPLPPRRLHGAAERRAPPLGLGVRLTSRCG